MPPMGMMPPPWYPPYKPKGGGFAKAIFVTLATTVLGASLLLNIYLLIAVGLTSGGISSQETVLLKGDPDQQVAVVGIEGTITGETTARFEKLLRELEDKSGIKVMVLELDTPGGELTASDELYHRILTFKKDRNIQVIASMGSSATSGGYYIACAADYIVAQPTTLTGNIGVVMQRFNFSKLMEKGGIEDTSITPEGSHFKYIESPFRPENPEATKYLRGLIDEYYGRFKDIVQTGRSSKLQVSIEQAADGRAVTATDALKMGLIDQIGYPADAYAKAAAVAGLTRPQVVRYHRQPSFLEALGASSASSYLRSGAEARDLSLRIDRRLLDELTAPRMMSLYRGG